MDPCCKLLNIYPRKCKPWRRGGLFSSVLRFGWIFERVRADFSWVRLMAALSQKPSCCSYKRSSQSCQTSPLKTGLGFSPAHVGRRGAKRGPPDCIAPTETSAMLDLKEPPRDSKLDPVCTKWKNETQRLKKNQEFFEIGLRILIS